MDIYKEEDLPTSLCGVISVVLITLQKKQFIFVYDFEDKRGRITTTVIL
jgi:hypothetical protein